MNSILDILNKKLQYNDDEVKKIDINLESAETEELYDVEDAEEKLQEEEENIDEKEIEVIEKEGMDVAAFEITKEERHQILFDVLSDSNITAIDSPFRTFLDEKQEFEIATPLVELRRVIQQYQSGGITDRMINILDIIIQHRNITSRQIWQMYLLKYKKYIKRTHLDRTLERMASKGLIAQFKLVNSYNGKSHYKVYSPEYNGIRLYSAIKNENISWKKTDTLQKAYNIKKNLAANQFLVAFLKNYDLSYKIQGRLAWTKGNGMSDSGVVKPALELTFRQAGDGNLESIVFLVEVLRTYEGWKEQFEEKLERYGKYLKSVEETRELKKYFIIICSESMEQSADAIHSFYEIVHVRKVNGLKDTMLYFITDMDLLDRNVKDDLLQNLQGMEFDYTRKEWVEKHPYFDLPKLDWHNLYFEIDKSIEIFKAEGIDDGIDTDNKNNYENLAKRIYNLVIENGMQFPVSITYIASLLKSNGINYQQLGFKKLKFMFADLEDFFSQYHKSPTEMMVTPTEEFKREYLHSIMSQEDNGEIKENHDDTSNENSEQPKTAISIPYTKVSFEQDMILEYIASGMAGKKKWNQQFRNQFFIRNWELSVAVLNASTQIYDFSAEGWYNILSYSYQMAKVKGNIMMNTKYLCFDTGIRTASYEKIFLLAEKNLREKPEWVLVGISTIKSKRLGEIIKKEFGL